MAQAKPVGPAPMTRTSVRTSGCGWSLALGRVSVTSAVKKLGIQLRVIVGLGTWARTLETDDFSMRRGWIFGHVTNLMCCSARFSAGPRYNLGLLHSSRSNQDTLWQAPAARLLACVLNPTAWGKSKS